MSILSTFDARSTIQINPYIYSKHERLLKSGKRNISHGARSHHLCDHETVLEIVEGNFVVVRINLEEPGV